MKKILFAAKDLNIGGIETALISLVNELVKEYKVTVVLEKAEGTLFEDLDKNVKVMEYNPSECKIKIIRKIINMFKRIKFTVMLKNKYDFAAAYATYSKMASFVARTASKNNALWGHSTYGLLYKDDDKMRDFFRGLNYDKFKHIIFAASDSKDDFIKVMKYEKDNIIFCNNLINYRRILKLSNEYEVEKDKRYTFLTVARHEEHSKKFTRLIEAAKMLKEEGLEFKVNMVGDGPETDMYRKLVKENNLNDNFVFLGRKQNPYPYFKSSDCLILTSEYEAFPVVCVEAMILKTPIITTNIADVQEIVAGKFGKVVEKDTNEIYIAMKENILNGFEITDTFDPEQFNKNIINKLKNIM